MKTTATALASIVGFCFAASGAQDVPAGERRLNPMDVFQLEWASDPRISPDGEHIVYVRNFMDVMQDRRRSNLWIVGFDGADHRAITTGAGSEASPRWSPDGRQLAYFAGGEDTTEIRLRWMDTGQAAVLARLGHSPGGLAWSPDGRWLAFSMFVEDRTEPFVKLPPKPDGAEWAEPAKVIRKLKYRADGAGYLEDGYSHLFVLSADGGTPRQLTFGAMNHGGDISWSADARSIVFAANRHGDWEYDPLDLEIYEVSLRDLAVRALTDRRGPDTQPAVSPDGTKIGYVGFDDREQGYQVAKLYVMNRDGSDARVLTEGLDRSAERPVWADDGRRIYFQYDDNGVTKVARVDLEGRVQDLVDHVGGETISRPYSRGSFTVARSGKMAFTLARPDRPADVGTALGDFLGSRAVTSLNEDLLGHKELGAVEELWCESSFDGRRVQSWIVKPPGFDPESQYPLILEIHGGPFANYGPRFAVEMQLYAAAGYVVLYVNPRGSTSYGEAFGNLIHHNYPGQDYDDLMSAVDAAIAKGYVDPDRLYVTGGSGGGVLTSWIVGKTARFRAAVVAKPVINWYSFALTADAYNFFYKYWFPGMPWDHAEHYMKRSPISYAGNITTPTMILTGEADYRTPMSESEQLYQALKLRRVDAALVRIPGASHDIAGRPSHLIAKVQHVLKWFEMHTH